MSYEKTAAYIVEIEQWRKEQEAELRSPDSWLSLTGLFVLQDGYYTVGSRTDNDIQLPASAPDYLGVITFSGGKARISVTADENVLIDGQAAREADLADNENRKRPTLVTVGSVTFFLHKFGDLYAIRVKDSTNPDIQTFAGREWFAVSQEYRVQGRFIPHDAPRLIPIKTIRDTNTKYPSVGTIEFTLHNQPLTLFAIDWGQPNRLHVSFRDATSGVESYGAARFLSVEVDEDGRATLDFNKAVNPPCAFTIYATCPLPPNENILSVPIAAGERTPNTKVENHAGAILNKLSV